MIIAKDAEKTLGKIQPSFMIKKKKNSQKTRNKRKLNLIKNIYEKPAVNILFNSGKLKVFP